MAKRVSKHWTPQPRLEVEKFNIDEIDDKNLINHLLKITHDDITYSTIMRLFGSFNGKTLCHQYDTFDVPAGAYEYRDTVKNKVLKNNSKFTTTIGIYIFNVFFLRDLDFAQFFGGYINESINNKKFNKINQTLVYALIEEKITTEAYQEFLDCTQFFMPFESILSPNHTEALLSCTKKINKKKEELYKKYKEGIDGGDSTIAEKMEQELLAYAKELLKDDPGLDVYESGAGGSFDNNFKNMYIMKGAIKDPDPNAKKEFNIAMSNYLDGISADEYSLLANSLTAGPYSRAKKTEVGGYWEKLFGAAFQTVSIIGEGTDCKTDGFIEVTLTDDNYSLYMYNNIIKSNGELEELTTDTLPKYLNKKVKMRFVTKCKAKGGYCEACAGRFFTRRGNLNIGLASIQVPAKIKLLMMKQFHDSTVKTVEIDPMKAFGLKK
jgi:hypothetical protein